MVRDGIRGGIVTLHILLSEKCQAAKQVTLAFFTRLQVLLWRLKYQCAPTNFEAIAYFYIAVV